MKEFNIHVCSLICNKTNGKNFKYKNTGFMRLASRLEIPMLRKESGLIMRKNVFLGEHMVTAYGEDQAKVVHAFLDGYEIYLAFVNITHMNNQNKEDSWSVLSTQMFHGTNRDLRKENFYGQLFFTKNNYLDKRQRLTSSAEIIHTYNKIRVDLKHGGKQ